MKKERYQVIQNRKHILDTLEVSDRKRQRLLRDIYLNPLSDRLTTALSEIDSKKGS